jgi:hypothetical protein
LIKVLGVITRNWQDGDLASALSRKIYATFGEGESSGDLPGLCLELLLEQKKTWRDLRAGYDALTHIRERKVACNGFAVRLQYNAGRMKSTVAFVGEDDTRRRPCFLCPPNLPEGQKGILYRSEYLILCNPMPVFPSHLTVSLVAHRLQAIADHIDTFLMLMVDLGSGWIVLYNGPQCGASAPDHLHFQAVPSGQMPMERELRGDRRLTPIIEAGGVLLSCANGLGRQAIILEGDDPVAIGEVFKTFLKSLQKTLNIDGEPMINLAGFYDGRTWHLVVFPRSKHRPDAFFRKGEGRLVISPAIVEMGGVLVTPVEKDFERLDAVAVEAIYREVSLDERSVRRVLDAIDWPLHAPAFTFPHDSH